MATKRETLQKTVDRLVVRPQVQEFLKKNAHFRRSLAAFKPKVRVVPLMDFREDFDIAGCTFDHKSIFLAPWILVDREEAIRTVVHELAHSMVFFCWGDEGDAHGKQWKSALKLVAGRGYRKYFGWLMSPKLMKARRKFRAEEPR